MRSRKKAQLAVGCSFYCPTELVPSGVRGVEKSTADTRPERPLYATMPTPLRNDVVRRCRSRPACHEGAAIEQQGESDRCIWPRCTEREGGTK